MRLGDDLRLASSLLVGATHVLCSLRRCVALTGLSPIVDGHSVVMPIPPADGGGGAVAASAALSDAEWLDLWRAAHLAQTMAESQVSARASNLLLREGGHASWADAPVHVHVVPRVAGDFARNDDVFTRMEEWRPPGAAAGGGAPSWQMPDDSERKDRTHETMAAEAAEYREQLRRLEAAAAAAAADDGGPDAKRPRSEAAAGAADRPFGKFSIPHAHVFCDSPSGLTHAFVNLRPLVKGHVLVTPRRVVPRLEEMSAAERADLFSTARRVQRAIAAASGGADVELGIQDGRDAGQSVPHVHVHVIPRARL